MIGVWFVNLMLTMSLTGIASVLLSVFFTNLIFSFLIGRTKVITFSIVFPLLILVVVVCFVFANLDISSELMDSKVDSINDHLSVVEIIKEINVDVFLGIEPKGVVTESGYINLISNYGFFPIIIFFIILVSVYFRAIVLMARYYRCYYSNLTWVDRMYIATTLSFLTFLLSFLIGLTNLPLERVFPVNALIPICSAILIIISNKISVKLLR